MDATIERNEPFPAITKIVVGLFFAVLGVVLTADNLDLINGEDFLRYWPAVLVLIGILKWFDRGGRILSIIFLVAGAWMLAYNMGVIHFTVFDAWPLILIGIGVGMVTRAMGVRPEGQSGGLAFFGTKKVADTSKDYRGGSVSAFLGGYILDLTGADISQGPAVLETLTMWGGIEIYVPEKWEIIGEVTPIMGGFEIKTSSVSDPRKQLIVKGMALMGGIEVKRKTV